MGEERNLHPGGRKYILINLIKFLKQSLHSKTTLTPLFFVEKQRVLPFIVQREKKHHFFEIKHYINFTWELQKNFLSFTIFEIIFIVVLKEEF